MATGDYNHDTMQICLNGHIITSRHDREPLERMKHCNICGVETTTNCPSCGESIQGGKWIEQWSAGNQIAGRPGRRLSDRFLPKREPDLHCQHCGAAYPWKDKLLAKASESTDLVHTILLNFPVFARQLLKRYNSRPSIDINDEYDVQDLLHAILRIHFKNVNKDEPTPSNSGGSAKIDFLLKDEKIGIEVKYATAKTRDREIGEQLSADIQRYQSHPNCKHLICFVYDPDRELGNPDSLKDLELDGEGFTVETIVVT